MSVDMLYKVTEIEVFYRNKVKAKDRPKIKSSYDAYEILRNSWDENKMDLREEFKILLLNRGLHCLGVASITSGGMTACLVDPKLIFITALKTPASSIILAHNHPSGNLVPSKEDEALTARLSDIGRLLEINVLDHIIMTSEGYTSMADDGNTSLVKLSGHTFTR